MRKFTIYGERCSGTNYLQNLIELNFDAEVTWVYEWKHFFGFHNLEDANDTLFICIARDLYSWLNSFYRLPHHWSHNHEVLNDRIDLFLNKEFYSINENGEEIMTDRHIYTKERYKNVFELRHTKLKYLLEDLPNKVENYIFIKYEDLIDDFENTMEKISKKGLAIKKNINFPVNSTLYKSEPNTTYKKNTFYPIAPNLIYKNENLIPKYEKLLGYIQ